MPMGIGYAVTLTSLVMLSWHHLPEVGGSLALGVTAVALLCVALVLAGLAARALHGARGAKPA